MTPNAFRKLALSVPGAIESQHMDHPDFRVQGKVFASLFRRDGLDWGMVRLPQEMQRSLCAEHPSFFEPLAGAWGRQGCTRVNLSAVRRVQLPLIRDALRAAGERTSARRSSRGGLAE